jgi:hypothetical protein
MIADMMKKAMQQQATPAGPAAAAGRNGDKILAHINPKEAALLKKRGGSGTINPKTGVLEFYEEGEARSDAMSGMDRGSNPGAGIDWSGLGLGTDVTAGYSGNYGQTAGAYSGGANAADGGVFNYQDPNAYAPSSVVDQYAGPYGLNPNSYAPDAGDAPTSGMSVDESVPGAGIDWSGLGLDAPNVTAGFDGSAGLDPSSYAPDTVDAGVPSPGAEMGAGSAAPGMLGAGGFFSPSAYGAFGKTDEDPANPLSSFGIGRGGQLLSSSVIDGNVYSQDPNAIGSFSNAGLSGLRGANYDDSDQLGSQFAGARGFAGDAGSNDAGTAETDGNGANRGVGGLRDSNNKASTGVVGSAPQSDSFSPVGPAGFGMNARGGFVEGSPITGKGSLFNEGFAQQVPGQLPAARDQSTFSTPVADAMARTYGANPNLPDGYLEGAYGIETNYGRNQQQTGSYKGPMQFSDKSIADVNPVGARNPDNPYDSMLAMSNEYNRMQKALGRNASAPEAYEMHQQGVTGGKGMIQNPGQPATNSVPARNLASNNLPTDILGGSFMSTPRVGGSPPFGSFFGSYSDYDPRNSLTVDTPAPTRMFQGN